MSCNYNGAKMRECEATCEKSSQVGNEPMTLDEAIAHAEESVNDTPCGQEHKQLADWLKELREIKNSNAAKLREAVENSNGLIEELAHLGEWCESAREQIKENNAALSAPSEPIGNGAKMREVLERCVKMLDICLLYSHEGYPGQNDDICETMDKAETALSTPPRNCDRFKTKEEAALAYAEECNAFIPQSILWEAGELLDWLFAEAKGKAE